MRYSKRAVGVRPIKVGSAGHCAEASRLAPSAALFASREKSGKNFSAVTIYPRMKGESEDVFSAIAMVD